MRHGMLLRPTDHLCSEKEASMPQLSELDKLNASGKMADLLKPNGGPAKAQW